MPSEPDDTSSPEQRVLWGSRERRFLIPMETEADNGYFPLTSMAGVVAFVKEASVLPYEVSQEEADAYLDRVLDKVFDEDEE